MCGITGIYNLKNSEVSEKTLIKMRDTLIHRGPDDKGVYVARDKKAGFGFRRLSIIDLSKNANQPMANEDKTIWLVFNGEIYNFKEIKSNLIKQGHQFKSKTDSETIIHLYEEKGEDCLEDLNGMYAFAIWDEKRKKMFVARDRLGIKPFYYYYNNGLFVFGSEIKAILEHPDVKKEPDLEGISHYLTFACTPAPFTLFKNIKKLPAAHYLTLDKIGHLETHRYWSPIQDTSYKIQDTKKAEQFYIQKVRELLQDSIERQMVSDVSFGCFLSGGIDSSTNAFLMSKAMGSPVETFSIAYEGFPKYDEFQYSRLTAEKLGSKKHEVYVGRKEFLEWLPKLSYYADDPNGDWVCFPVYYLAKLFRDNGVIMGQVGEGSDELFCGYDSYMVFVDVFKKYWRYFEKLPVFIKKIPYWAINNFSGKNKIVLFKELFRRLAYNKPLFYGGANAFSAYDKQFLSTKSFQKQISFDVSDKIIESIYQEIQDTRYKIPNAQYDFLQKLLYLELNLRLPELLLMRVDKMVSVNSIEARVPFLDHRLVELAFSMPMELKIKNNTPKYILKKAVEGIIPDEIIYRKKKGFGAPVSEWLKENSDLSRNLIKIIENSRIKELDIFNYNYIKQLIEDHQSLKQDNSFKLWNLITLSLWYDKWLGK